MEGGRESEPRSGLPHILYVIEILKEFDVEDTSSIPISIDSTLLNIQNDSLDKRQLL